MRRIRYIFDYNDDVMMKLFAQGGYEASRAEISDWLKQEEADDYKNCGDNRMAAFLNGLIIEKRGKRDGEQPKPENKLTNNMIFMKLKIALNMKGEDVMKMLEVTGMNISNHELSALFRKPGHKHYRECKDQILRNFLKGLQAKERPEQPE
jgi:uncharacterized protein YehS (DUF1456 family)